MAFLRFIHKAVNAIVTVLFALICTLILLQVFGRLFHFSRPWIDELTRFSFVWLTYIGGAITVRQGMNISFDLLLDSCKGKVWECLFIAMNILGIAFLAALAILGFINCRNNMIQMSTVMRMNMGLVNLSMC